MIELLAWQIILTSPDAKKALNSIHKDLAVAPIDKATTNITVVCKTFYASVVAKELELNNN